MSTPDDLRLYVRPGCGYCEDVRRAARALGLTLEEVDIWRDPDARRALVAARGRQTVPVLRIGEDQWLPESRDIIRYLRERFGDAEPPSRGSGPWLHVVLWGLLLGGGVAAEPWRSVLWTAACAVAAGRSAGCALRTGYWAHWAVAGAFATGAVSIALAALDVADLPWWYAAFAVVAAVLGGAVVQRLRGGRATCR